MASLKSSRARPRTAELFDEDTLMAFMEAIVKYASGKKRLVHCLDSDCVYFGLMLWVRDDYLCPCCGEAQVEVR